MLKRRFVCRSTLVSAILVLQVVSIDVATAQETAPAAESAPADAPGFFFWTDTSVSVLPYGWGYEVDPSDQSAITLEHAHESTIGDMFAFVDFIKFHDTSGDDTTWYGEIGPRLSFAKLFDKDISYVLFRRSLFEIKDVLLAAQYERGEDPGVAEAVLLGVGFDLDVREAGILGGLAKFNYVQLNLYGRSELTEDTPDGFRDMQMTLVASYPFQIGKYQFLLDGYFDWVLGIGNEEWSYHLNPQVTMDLGAVWDRPNKLYVGVELDLWWNKYQIPDSSDFDTDQVAVSLLMKYHL